MTGFNGLWRPAVASTICSLITVAVAAAALTPPAVTMAIRYLSFAAIIMIATVLTTVLVSFRSFDRSHRLIAFVLVVATGMSWYAGRLQIHERQFDYLVASQKTDLRLRTIELSGNIVNFLRRRARGAPRPPAAASWEEDVNALLRYEVETSLLFEQVFGPQVRTTHDLLMLEGLTDRDLDVFYRRPANAFQIDVIARKLDALGRRLDRV